MKDKLNAAKGILLGLLIGAVMWLLILSPIWMGACDAEARPRDYVDSYMTFVCPSGTYIDANVMDSGRGMLVWIVCKGENSMSPINLGVKK